MSVTKLEGTVTRERRVVIVRVTVPARALGRRCSLIAIVSAYRFPVGVSLFSKNVKNTFHKILLPSSVVSEAFLDAVNDEDLFSSAQLDLHFIS